MAQTCKVGPSWEQLSLPAVLEESGNFRWENPTRVLVKRDHQPWCFVFKLGVDCPLCGETCEVGDCVAFCNACRVTVDACTEV